MRLVVFVLVTGVAWGQASRVFPLSHNQSGGELQQIATLLRATTDLAPVSIDETKKTGAVTGTPVQIAMAEWLVQQLDVAAGTPHSGVHEYRPPPGGDDVVRVFSFTHALTPQQMQEILTAIRLMGDVRRMFLYSPLRAAAMRGTGQQISLAAWLIGQLDQPENASAPAPHEYALGSDDVARALEMRHAETPQQLQEIATIIRTIGDMPRVFTNTARRAVVLRARAEQVALAAWLVGELDRPAGMPDAAATHEYRLSWSAENLVRIFFLGNARGAAENQQVAAQVRSTARIPRLFIYNSLSALTVRGTAGQVATAEKMLEEIRQR